MTIANESGGKVPCRFCGVPWDRAKFSKCDCGAALDCYGNEQVGPVTYRTPEEWAKDIPQEDGAREGVARWTAETEWSHEGQCDVTKVLEDPHGEFVKHEDHLAELSRLKAERDAALGRYADALRDADSLRTRVTRAEMLLHNGMVCMRDAKRQFAPHTTNSIADETIDRIARFLTPTPAAERGGGRP
jgi:hypothetical protein